MKLTRRDAVVAVAAGVGASAVSVGLAERDVGRDGRESLTDHDIATLIAVADVVYPSEIDATGAFVETYADRIHASRRRGIARAIEDLDRAARRRHGRPFASLSPETGDRVLRDLGVHRVVPVADGTVPERIRSFLVNGLMFALYTSPAGSRLVGIENPVGYPGGYESYQEEPDG